MLLIATSIAACGDDVKVPEGPVVSAVAMPPAPRLDVAASARSVAGGPPAGESAPNASQDAALNTPGAAVQPSSMIIRNGSASVEVEAIEPAMAAVTAMVTRLGGYVGNTSVSNGGQYQVPSATLELKIPAARFDSALAGLRPLGVVENVSTTSEDVGEEFVDISARVANAKRLEARLIDLLATRTGRLEDVVAVERELARVREEIERYEGRIRYLKNRVDISTLLVTVHEPAPLSGQTPGQNVLVQAFKRAWRNFVDFIAGFIALLGVIVPFTAILLAVGYVFRRWRRSRRARQSP